MLLWLIKSVPGTPGDLMVQINLSPHNGFVGLKQINLICKALDLRVFAHLQLFSCEFLGIDKSGTKTVLLYFFIFAHVNAC